MIHYKARRLWTDQSEARLRDRPRPQRAVPVQVLPRVWLRDQAELPLLLRGPGLHLLLLSPEDDHQDKLGHGQVIIITIILEI